MNKLLKYIALIIKRGHFFGFVSGHSYLTKHEVDSAKSLLVSQDNSIVDEYEAKFASMISPQGFCVSFASGRMAFYSLLKSLGVGAGDEVILTGFTCSVMVNAVFRSGATPIYADINLNTLGTDPDSVAYRITSRTKAIVAQHSFGIPCQIKEIAGLADKAGIFLIEDCAIAFDAAINGQKVGTFGIASIFSTDHSKPINTIVGGILYTASDDVYQKIKSIQNSSKELTHPHKLALLKQFLFEKKFQNPDMYLVGKLVNAAMALFRKIKLYSSTEPFLIGDYSSVVEHLKYPYPAKLPNFLAKLGLLELDKWPSEKIKRKLLLEKILDLARHYQVGENLPSAYFDKNLEIIPLRFVFFGDNDVVNSLKDRIDTDWFWFTTPIICTNDLMDLKYILGNCPVSESTNKIIINIPCVFESTYNEEILLILEELFKRYKVAQ